MRELYQRTIRETSLNITRWTIDSIRKKTITKSGCRIYRDGFIGVAGTLGAPDDSTWAEAEANLSEQIPYPYAPTTNSSRSQDLAEETLDAAGLVAEMEACLAICRERYPKLALSNKVNLMDVEHHLTNDSGLDLHYHDRLTMIALLVKHADSANVFDSVVATVHRKFDRDRFLKQVDDLLGGYDKRVDLPETDKPIIVISQDDILGKLNEELSGRKMGRGASLLTGKTGQTVFSERFSLYRDASEAIFGEPFFDMEGTTLPHDRLALIDRGVIRMPYADKKTAAEFNLALTASAGGAYDDVPTLASGALNIASDGLTLKELLNGEPGIYVVIAAGGDFTSDGQFASPVQMAYLTDGERMLGRLPEFSVSGSLYDLFGKDFIGVTADTPFSHEHLAVVRMQLAKQE